MCIRDRVDHLLQLCKNYDDCRNNQKRREASKKISTSVNTICGASNKNEFAKPILNALQKSGSNEARMRLFTIARKIGTEWSASEKSKLAKECINQLMAPLQGLSIQGSSVSVNGQAVLALCICASKEQANELVSLHNDPKLFQPCLYTHGKTRTQLDWVYNEFHRDVDKVKKGKHSNLQFSSYAMGCAFRKEKENDDGMAECAMPVSYTHLDVYKRQELISEETQTSGTAKRAMPAIR